MSPAHQIHPRAVSAIDLKEGQITKSNSMSALRSSPKSCAHSGLSAPQAASCPFHLPSARGPSGAVLGAAGGRQQASDHFPYSFFPIYPYSGHILTSDMTNASIGSLRQSLGNRRDPSSHSAPGLTRFTCRWDSSSGRSSVRRSAIALSIVEAKASTLPPALPTAGYCDPIAGARTRAARWTCR
jgi:hypothetical protein